MLKLIIEKELLTRFSDTTFVIICILSALLIFLSFYLSVRNYSDLVDDYNGTQILNRNLLQAQETYWGISTKGINISKPPEVLAIFNVGIANYIGRNLNINSFITSELQGSKIESNPVWALFGDLNLTFIIKYILSLLAIICSYNLLSGEKERGTLRLVASFPVPRDTLILGKLIGGLLSLFIPLLIPTLLSLAVLLLLPSVQFASNDWLRLIFILGIFLLYLTVFFLIGTYVSARTKSVNVSFLIALFIWVLVVLVIPKSSSILAEQFIQVSSSQQYRIEKVRLWDDLSDKYDQKRTQLTEDYTAQQNIETSRELREKLRDEYLKKMDGISEQKHIELEKKQAQMEREYQQQQRNLATLAITLSRISPAAAMTHATMNFADTGLGSFDHFIRSAYAYKERYIAFIKEKLHDFRNVETSEKPNVNEMPMFIYEKMPLAYVIQETLIDMLLLILLSLLFFIGTYVSFLKYDVR